MDKLFNCFVCCVSKIKKTESSKSRLSNCKIILTGLWKTMQPKKKLWRYPGSLADLISEEGLCLYKVSP